MTTTATPHTPAPGPAGSPAGAAPARRSRGPRLSGLTWLVWRQHRAAFWFALAVTAAAIAWFAYARAGLVEFFAEADPSRTAGPDGGTGFTPHADRIAAASSAVGLLAPVLAGVLLGAPLIANDLEQGTGRLVMTQSVGRSRWIATKLGMAVLVAAVCSAALSAAYGRLLEPAGERDKALYWIAGSASGPVPVALTLCALVGSVAIGMVLRRTLLSMVAAFGFSLALPTLWTMNWMATGEARTVTTTDGAGLDDFPELPRAAMDMEQWYVTSSGRLLEQDVCAGEGRSEKVVAACLEQKDVVGWSVEYMPTSQLTPMLWTGAAIMLTLTAAMAAFVLWWGRRRLF